MVEKSKAVPSKFLIRGFHTDYPGEMRSCWAPKDNSADSVEEAVELASAEVSRDKRPLYIYQLVTVVKPKNEPVEVVTVSLCEDANGPR